MSKMNTTYQDISQEQSRSFESIGLKVKDSQSGIVSIEDVKKWLPEGSFSLFTEETSDDFGCVVAYLAKTNPSRGYLGWFAAAENRKAGEKVLISAMNWLKNKGCKIVLGPIDGCTWNNYRFNLDADQPLFIGEPYQPSFYLDLWKGVGFKENLLYESSIAPKEKIKPVNREQVEGLLLQKEAFLENLPEKQSNELLKELHEFNHCCFEENPCFESISIEQYIDLSNKIAAVVDYEHSFILRDKDDRIISFFLSFKDVLASDAKSKRLYIKTLATKPEWRNQHLGTIMINYITYSGYQHGYKDVIFSLMESNNLSATKGKTKFGAEIIRQYALYELKL